MKKDKLLFVKMFFLVTGVISFFSSAMYSFSDNTELWFSRFALGIICLGFYSVIYAVEDYLLPSK